MKEIFKYLLVLALFLSFMPYADAKTHGERMMDKNYRAAIRSGCEDIKVKGPKKAMALGFFLGFGSFYTEETALGIADLLMWPVSILWDGPLANQKAHRMNKEETIMICKEQNKL